MALAAEADALPFLLSHGDACPNNLLAGAQDDDLVMIDFGFWGGAPVGFDLSQLLVGDIQIGKRGADDLAELDEAIVAAYVAGLRAEGCEIPEEQIRRGHALCLLIMTGLSAAPFDLFEGPINERDASGSPPTARSWPATPSISSTTWRGADSQRERRRAGSPEATPPVWSGVDRSVRGRPDAGPGRWRARSACCPC